MSTPHLSISVLSLLIAQAFATTAQAQTSHPSMAEVVVSAARGTATERVSVGGFVETPLQDTPASVTVIELRQMQDLRIRQTTDATKFDASVNDAYNAVGYAEQFSIRGFALDNSSSYRKDGLAIPGDTQIALENKERIDILKGLAGLHAGIAAPGGIINYVTKRPTNTNLRSATVEASERGTLYGAMDLGGRFDDKRFGYRINAAGERLRSYIKGANGERQFASAAFDWQLAPNALLQLDLDYQHKSQISAPGYQLFGGVTVPTNVPADVLLNDQPWTRPVDTRSSNVGLRVEYQFNAGWRASATLNSHQFKRDDYTAFPYGCSSGPEYISGFCANGDFDVYDYRSLNESKSPLAAQALVHGKLIIAAMQHALTLGVAGSRRRDRFGDFVYDVGDYSNFISNVFKPVVVPAATDKTPSVASLRRSDDERAVFVQDIVQLSDAWTLHAGLRAVSISRDELQRDIHTDHRFILPNLALVYSPMRAWTVYGAYSAGMEHGGIAPLGTSNVGQGLGPNKSKQFEWGLKGEFEASLVWSVSMFQITKPLELITLLNSADAQPTYARSGDATHRGLELSLHGKAAPGLNLGLSMTGINARQHGTEDAGTDGKRVANVPSFKSSIFFDYAMPQLAGLKLNGTWLTAASKAFSPDNRVSVPGYQVVNLGASYATHMAGTRVTLRANIDNVFNKFYWRDVTQELGGYLFPGAPRTFKVSAQFDF